MQPAYAASYEPPGAIYMDALGAGGTTRTDAPASDKHGFAYADTLILWSVRRACRGTRSESNSVRSAACEAADAALSARRALNPMLRWDDPATGRHSDWPPLKP